MPKSVPQITNGPKPVGPYSVATEANGFVFVSGQVAFDPVTHDHIAGDTAAEAERVMTNIGLILGDAGLTYDDIVKTTIFLLDIADFAAVNEVYAKYFTGAPPARSTFQVAALPVGFKVEIEVIAAR
ncbi:MAG: Rid family detoxifying hydrolase [Actinomycetota bacterium]